MSQFENLLLYLKDDQMNFKIMWSVVLETERILRKINLNWKNNEKNIISGVESRNSECTLHFCAYHSATLQGRWFCCEKLKSLYPFFAKTHKALGKTSYQRIKVRS